MAAVQLSPRQRVEAECSRRGRPTFIEGCVALLEGRQVDTTLLMVLGGLHGEALLARDLPEEHRYWLRVWAARGLLWAWDDSARPALGRALRDPAWRVREMAAKVVARHRIGELTAAVSALRADAVPRVSAAAARALAAVTRAGA